MDGGMEADAMRTLYKVPTILAMEGTTSSRRTMDAETLATEGGGADQLLRFFEYVSPSVGFLLDLRWVKQSFGREIGLP